MYPSQSFFWRQTYLLCFSFKCYVTPIVYELVWPQGLFGRPPDHMDWFALLLLVKFKNPGWFYFIGYSYLIFGVENTLLNYGRTQGQNPKSADPFLSGDSSWGYDMFCGWKDFGSAGWIPKWKWVCEADYYKRCSKRLCRSICFWAIAKAMAAFYLSSYCLTFC